MANATAVKPHIPYTITSQEKTQSLVAGGRFINVWKVEYEAPNGVHSFVEIPVNEWTPANVDNAIQAELDGIMGVDNLGPEPHPENLAE